jgi:hypothetical protein
MNTPTTDRGPRRRASDIRRLLTRRSARVVGAAAVLMTSVLVVASSPVSATPAAHGKPGTGVELPPPPQISALNPLLGEYKCDDATAPDQQFIVNNTRTLDGHYQNSEATVQPGNLHGLSSIGWDPVNGVFFSQYHDNWGSHSTETSPGWEDGHLVFTGDLSQVVAPDPTGHAQGAELKLTDDYSDVRRGHFKTVTTVSLNGVDFVHSYDCHRIG